MNPAAGQEPFHDRQPGWMRACPVRGIRGGGRPASSPRDVWEGAEARRRGRASAPVDAHGLPPAWTASSGPTCRQPGAVAARSTSRASTAGSMASQPASVVPTMAHEHSSSIRMAPSASGRTTRRRRPGRRVRVWIPARRRRQGRSPGTRPRGREAAESTDRKANAPFPIGCVWRFAVSGPIPASSPTRGPPNTLVWWSFGGWRSASTTAKTRIWPRGPFGSLRRRSSRALT